MNKKLNVKNLKQREIMPGFHGRFVNGENITWAFWEIEKDSSIPDHFHTDRSNLRTGSKSCWARTQETIEGKKSLPHGHQPQQEMS